MQQQTSQHQTHHAQAHPRTLRHSLDCGMPLLMLPGDDLPVATADVWVRTGAADEPGELAGVSHFLEHMLFKGTEKWGLGEIERTIERVGGVSNAATSYDFTHYHVTMPSGAIGLGIEMLSEMVRHSSLDATELEKERLVILEEYRRKQDYPPGVLYERLYGELFAAGVYHEPVIGTEETIRSIDRPRMLDYFLNRYSPANMGLVVTGRIKPDQIIAKANAAFTGFNRPLRQMRPDAPTRYGTGRRLHIDKPTGGEIYVAYAFPAPGMARVQDVLPLDVAQFILGSGRASLLNQALHEKQKLCSSIGTYFPTMLHDSLFVVGATCLPEQLDSLRAGLLEELKQFVAAPPETKVMERARRLLASAHRFSMETSGGQASSIGYYYTLTGGTEFFDSYLETLATTTPAQVREAAATCLRPEAMVEVSVGPAA